MDALQLFLLADMFVLGIIATIAIQHAYTHFLHKRHPERDHAALKDSPLPQETKERLIKEAHDNFQDVLDASADSLQHDLKTTADQLNAHLEELGNDTIHKEVERYREQLEQLYNHAEKDVSGAVEDVNNYIADHKQKLDKLSSHADTAIDGANKDIENYKQELKNKLDQLYERADTAITDVSTDIDNYTKELKQQLSKDIEAEKQQLLERLDTKLADAVTSFLMETLRHNVDLGAQNDYLTSMLEEHKSELKEGVKNEVKTSK